MLLAPWGSGIGIEAVWPTLQMAEEDVETELEEQQGLNLALRK
ncbi:MAG: hypothetical protein ACQPRI_06390 [Solitalea-like symbiont of Tyrophagus putrescentiae]